MTPDVIDAMKALIAERKADGWTGRARWPDDPWVACAGSGAVATNGFALVVRSDMAGVPRGNDCPKTDPYEVPGQATNYRQTTTLGAVRAWAEVTPGAPPKHTCSECETCEGEGECNLGHDHECEDCDGSGREGEQDCPACKDEGRRRGSPVAVGIGLAQGPGCYSIGHVHKALRCASDLPDETPCTLTDATTASDAERVMIYERLDITCGPFFACIMGLRDTRPDRRLAP